MFAGNILQDATTNPSMKTKLEDVYSARANVSDCFATLHRSIVGFYTVGTQTGSVGRRICVNGTPATMNTDHGMRSRGETGKNPKL